MAMTVNPAVTADSVAPLRVEAVFAFHFDTDADRCDVQRVLRRMCPRSADATQALPPGRVSKSGARRDSRGGDLLACARTDAVGCTDDGIRVFAGVVEDPFAGNVTFLEAFKARFARRRFGPEAFSKSRRLLSRPQHRRNCARSAESINHQQHSGQRVGDDIATRACPRTNRWLPLLTHIFLRDAELRERFPGANRLTTIRHYLQR
jgi:hypothetical protein